VGTSVSIKKSPVGELTEKVELFWTTFEGNPGLYRVEIPISKHRILDWLEAQDFSQKNYYKYYLTLLNYYFKNLLF